MATSKNGVVTYETKYFYSQDGARWSDLQPVDAETATRCARIKGYLSGDAAKNYELEEKDPNAPEPAEGEDEVKPLVFQVPELSVLRYRVDSITGATSVIPTVGDQGWGMASRSDEGLVRPTGGREYAFKLKTSARPSWREARCTKVAHYMPAQTRPD